MERKKNRGRTGGMERNRRRGSDGRKETESSDRLNLISFSLVITELMKPDESCDRRRHWSLGGLHLEHQHVNPLDLEMKTRQEALSFTDLGQNRTSEVLCTEDLNQVVSSVCRNMGADFGLLPQAKEETPPKMVDNDRTKVLWDLQIQTDNQTLCNRRRSS